MADTLVTGAARGLGLALVRQLLERGDRVFAAARGGSEREELRELRRAHPDSLVPIALDVSDPQSIAESVNEVRKHTDALDLLINNAGIASGQGGSSSTAPEPLGRVEQGNSLQVFAVNTVGPLLMVQAHKGLLARAKAPRVVNVTSRMGSIEDKSSTGYYSYSASKAALNMVNKILSRELSREGIVTIVVHPGWVQTDMGGGHATLLPEESAAALIRLVSALSEKDNGAFFSYDGSPLPW